MNNLLRLQDGGAEWVRDDPWQLIRDATDELPAGPLILPLPQWLALNADRTSALEGVWLGPNDEVTNLTPWFPDLPLIALDFPSFSRRTRLQPSLSAAYAFRLARRITRDWRCTARSTQPHAPMRFRQLCRARRQIRRRCAEGIGRDERALWALGD